MQDQGNTKALTKNQVIFNSISPWNNKYQGADKKVLFVCSAGILRSATGARIYASRYNTRAAGSEEYALIHVSSDLLLWADVVVFVNEENYLSVQRRFDLDTFDAEVIILQIPDHFDHMQPELVLEFHNQFEPVDGTMLARIMNRLKLT